MDCAHCKATISMKLDGKHPPCELTIHGVDKLAFCDAWCLTSWAIRLP